MKEKLYILEFNNNYIFLCEHTYRNEYIQYCHVLCDCGSYGFVCNNCLKKDKITHCKCKKDEYEIINIEKRDIKFKYEI